MTNTGAIIAAVKFRRERTLVRVLRDRGAYAPVNAVPIHKQPGFANRALSGLVRNGAIVESKPGFYWLNEAAYRRLRTRRALTLGAVMLVGLIAVMLAVYLAR